jgi:hypothetical protein
MPKKRPHFEVTVDHAGEEGTPGTYVHYAGWAGSPGIAFTSCRRCGAIVLVGDNAVVEKQVTQIHDAWHDGLHLSHRPPTSLMA